MKSVGGSRSSFFHKRPLPARRVPRSLRIGAIATIHLIASFHLVGGSADAVDTLELFDIGFSDFEFYFGYGGVGKESPERYLGAEGVIGVGITGWLSGFLRASGEANDQLSEGTGEFGFGAFSTPLDTKCFDLDIGIDVGIGQLGAGGPAPAGHSNAALSFTPFVELNLDSDPEMNGLGLFAFVEYTFGGRDDSWIDPLGEEVRKFTVTHGTALTIGAYYTILDGHQALLAYNMNFLHNHAPTERTMEVGGLAVGYNFFVVKDVLEIITEVNFDIPQDQEDFGVDFLVGFIATLSQG